MPRGLILCCINLPHWSILWLCYDIPSSINSHTNTQTHMYHVNLSFEFATWFLKICISWLAAVTATMPGYKSKTTRIWLDEEATNVDFILEPEGTTKGKLLRSICYDTITRLGPAESFWGFHLEIYLLLIIFAALLCFLIRRRVRSFSLSKHKQSGVPRRTNVVWTCIKNYSRRRC